MDKEKILETLHRKTKELQMNVQIIHDTNFSSYWRKKSF